MPSYQPPLKTVQFLLHEVIGLEKLQKLPQYAEVNRDLADAILEAAGSFMAEELFPLNMSGDEEGCHWQDGEVTAPKGFREAYRKYIELGLAACPPRRNMAGRACRLCSIPWPGNSWPRPTCLSACIPA